MVVAEDGPVKKKPRLSLKSNKKMTPKTADEATKAATPLDLKTNETTCEDSVTHEVSTETESYAPYDGPLVPPVASLENLGNTCFLNSILQVLRYTPKFLNGLTDLYKKITMLEKAAREKIKQEDVKEEDASNDEVELSWELAKKLYKMYKDMDKNEERYSEIASADVTSMAVRPTKILDIIREFNPMFEGNFQHDAQELLRCLLCYLEDAQKAFNVKYEKLQPFIVKQSPKVNPIMKKFLLAGHNSVKTESITSHPKKILDELELEHCLDKQSLKRGKRASDSDLVVKSEKKSGSKLGVRKRLSSGSYTEKESLTDSRSQPSIASVFNGPKKRLGMRGVTRPCTKTTVSHALSSSTDLNNNEDFLHDINNNENSLQNKNTRSTSPAELTNVLHRLTCNSPKPDRDSVKQPHVRLQKCDNVCDSPLKTVNATQAIKSLNCAKRKRVVTPSPVKDVWSRPNGTEIKAEITPSPAKRKVSFDEDNSASFQFKRSFSSPKATQPKTLHLNNAMSPSSAFRDELRSPSSLRRSPRKTDSPYKSTNESTPTKQSSRPQNSPVMSSPSMSPRRQSPRSHKTATDIPMKSPSSNTKVPPVFKSPLPNVSPSPAKRKVNFDLLDEISTQAVARKSPRKSDPLPCSSSYLSPKKSPRSSSSKSSETIVKNEFVEQLFQGTMMLRTKCIECEFARERKEDFQDVSVPLRREKEDLDSDDETDEVDDSCLSKLMSAFSEVERLKDDNKYFCENCFRYVEAERSLHYEVLPDVLTLHLKRFSASDRLYGSLVKINDHITLPVTLPCLQYQCPRSCNKPSHRYSLYGIVTHAGTTITSGHYLSYVKVNSNSSSDDITAQSDGPNVHLINQSSTPFSTEWYECDDEAIRIYSDGEFRQKLIGKESSLMGTPYVLFYHRQNLVP